MFDLIARYLERRWFEKIVAKNLEDQVCRQTSVRRQKLWGYVPIRKMFFSNQGNRMIHSVGICPFLFPDTSSSLDGLVNKMLWWQEWTTTLNFICVCVLTVHVNMCIICVHANVCIMYACRYMHVCGGPRTTCKNQVSPSITWGWVTRLEGKPCYPAGFGFDVWVAVS